MRVGGSRLALAQKTVQFPQGSRQRGKRAGGPFQLARMRGPRGELRDGRLDGGQDAGNRAFAAAG
jgi:hypothetical protein